MKIIYQLVLLLCIMPLSSKAMHVRPVRRKLEVTVTQPGNCYELDESPDESQPESLCSSLIPPVFTVLVAIVASGVVLGKMINNSDFFDPYKQMNS